MRQLLFPVSITALLAGALWCGISAPPSAVSAGADPAQPAAKKSADPKNSPTSNTAPNNIGGNVDRSPIDLILSADESHLVSVNQTSHSLSLMRVADRRVVDEVPCGQRPFAIALSPQGLICVTASDSGELLMFRIKGDRLEAAGSIPLGLEPRGIALTADGKSAWVALAASAEVIRIDLATKKVAARVGVARWPHSIALSPDGTRLAVACQGDRSISVVDTQAEKLLFSEKHGGINQGQLQVSADNKYVYLPYMEYRQTPITVTNIQLGWVLGTRIARLHLDKARDREAITLDPRGKAVADPHGIGLTPDQQWIVCTGSGTHELLVYKASALKFLGGGGPGDHIDPALLRNPEVFDRIPLGGRPMCLRIARDGNRVFIANYLSNEIQIVDLAARQVTQSIHLGGPKEPSLARQGEAIFYDGGRSLDQWYSCHSCHYEAGTNTMAMDTMNDGSIRTFKTVLPLYNVTHTAPWTWHGWQKDLHAAMHKSLTETMLGPRPTKDDVEAMIAYLTDLKAPANPHRAGGTISESAQRGKQIFEGAKGNCVQCHRGPYFTDGEVHDVGSGSASDVYKGYNTPSLLGVYRKVLLFHHGRAKSLEDVLTEFHNPANVAGQELTPAERADLIEYLKTL